MESFGQIPRWWSSFRSFPSRAWCALWHSLLEPVSVFYAPLWARHRNRPSRCFSAQVWQRVWPRIAEFGQSLQRLISLAFRRRSWAATRWSSLRSVLSGVRRVPF